MAVETTSQDSRQPTGLGPKELLVMISSIMALMALGIDLMLPAFDDIRAAFSLGDDAADTGQIITVYFFGLAIAQLGWGPLADRYGRKPVLYASIGVYLVSAVAAALAPTFAALLIARFVWGVGAAGARVTATAIVRDRFVGDEMARALSMVMAVFLVVPVLAPALGSLIIWVLEWRSLFWFCAICAAGIAAWSLRLNETLAPEHVRPLNVRSTAGAYAEVFLTPVSLGYTVAGIFLQATMTSYLATADLVIGSIFDLEDAFPYIFGAVALAFGAAALINSAFVTRFGIDGMVNGALRAAVVLGVIVTTVAVTTEGQPSAWIFMPLFATALASQMLIMPNINTAALTPVGHIAGAAAAFTGAFRTFGGAAIAAAFTPLLDDSVTPLAILMLTMTVLASVTVAIVRRFDRRTAGN